MAHLPNDTAQLSHVMMFLTRKFEAACIETAALDARLLLQHVTGLTHTEIISKPDTALSSSQLDDLSKLFARRIKREPISRIIGKTEFWSLPFLISDDTLDPRPDTETMIELALEMIGPRKYEPLRLLDLGTGSGCILLSLLHELPLASGVGVDLNPGAVEMATQNAAELSLEKRADFRVSDWFSTVEGKFDVILSNPPYIPEAELMHLMPEVRDFDPVLALNGGESGLFPYEIIVNEAKDYLEQDGTLIFEFGQDQEKQLIDLLYNSHLGCFIETVEQKVDLAGIIRTIGVKFCF